MKAHPLTANEREERFVKYVLTLNKGQIAELRLNRLNRISNFRKVLMQLLNELVENRAEDLAAGMLMAYAPERKKLAPTAITEGRLPVKERKRVMPPWIREEGRALAANRRQGTG